MRKETSVYLDGGRGQLLSESSRLLDNVTKRFRKNKQRQEQQANLEMDARWAGRRYFINDLSLMIIQLFFRRGYAFSQEEGGAVTQEQIIRRYDTTCRAR